MIIPNIKSVFWCPWFLYGFVKKHLEYEHFAGHASQIQRHPGCWTSPFFWPCEVPRIHFGEYSEDTLLLLKHMIFFLYFSIRIQSMEFCAPTKTVGAQRVSASLRGIAVSNLHKNTSSSFYETCKVETPWAETERKTVGRTGGVDGV